ncbi:hypothetical protein AN901_202659 [Pseudomonas syringae pv. theae]|nr:hypothetical protein AN901_202659 [Pseudomonas syringae pv. theae]OSN68652.1 hypothetical protein BV349_00972 [Pseudomonas syringae pv. actinidiae]OSN78893.1 hypothetical protein BV351_00970 [Pseudomonas syringae pv. actinidiae]RMS14718.1 hypothetical protein ALP75_202950 [Pseudomonas syringae pv. actinidiae]RMS53614.1 hypothetical protein ALP64_203797 [Pseudomonas syringae pv. actinidiae]
MQHDALFVAMRAGNQRLLCIDWKIAFASKLARSESRSVTQGWTERSFACPQSAKHQSFTPNVTNALRGVPT